MTDHPRDSRSNIVAEPAIFDGNRKQFATWFRQIQLFVKAKDDIDTDEKKIMATLSRMRGGVAGPWADTYTDKALETNQFGKWSEFQTRLKTMFEDHTAKITARDKIQNLRQGKLMIDEFFTEFEMLKEQAKMTDKAELMRLLDFNVKHELVHALYTSSSEFPETYEKKKEQLMNIGHMNERWEEMSRAMSKSFTPHGSTFRPTSRPPTTTTQTIPDQDKKTATGITFGGAGKPMEIDKARKEGLCFGCGKPGHISRNCPDKQKGWNMRSIAESLNEGEKEELRALLTEEDQHAARGEEDKTGF